MPTVHRREPLWPYATTIVVAVALHYALPDPIRPWPPWLGAIIVLALAIVGYWASEIDNRKMNQMIGYALAAALTIATVYGTIRLVHSVIIKAQPPLVLLSSAAILWPANVITFALWYWRLDAGGPLNRWNRDGAHEGAFLFPQMVPSPKSDDTWRPHFFDYLFVAFNTATAFSPTDVPVLSRWAKLLTMIESIISLTIVIVLVARSINTL